MATLTVGSNQPYTTISAAVAASATGDTIDVEAGTYTNDFVSINHDLTLNAVGGTVSLVATDQPPNGKALIDEGGSGVSVTITGFDISGVTVPDGNGAAIRYEGGTLVLNNDTIHDNQEGLLGANDPNGSITINGSTFADNGSGTGYTHNLYVGDIANLTVQNSTFTSAVVGHDIKSRAESTTISDNTIIDGSAGTASYEIDLPNGGNAVIEGNVIQKGAGAQNPIAISFGEEGGVYASSSLLVDGNTIINDDTAATTTAVVNASSVTAVITGNTLYSWSNVSSGPAMVSGTTTPTTEPALSSLTPGSSTSSSSGGTVSTDPATTDTTSAGTTSTGTTSTGTTSTGTTSTASGTTSDDPGDSSATTTDAGSTPGDSTSSGTSVPVTAGTVGSSGSPGFVSGGFGAHQPGSASSASAHSATAPAEFAHAAREAGAHPYASWSDTGNTAAATYAGPGTHTHASPAATATDLTTLATSEQMVLPHS